MGAITQTYGTAGQSLTVTGLSTLANGSYAKSADIAVGTAEDVLVTLSITPGTTTGNKQAGVWFAASQDGTAFDGGGSNGDTLAANNQGQWRRLGWIPLLTASEAVQVTYSLKGDAMRGGLLPPHGRIIILNDSGAAFAAGAVTTQTINRSVA